MRGGGGRDRAHAVGQTYQGEVTLAHRVPPPTAVFEGSLINAARGGNQVEVLHVGVASQHRHAARGMLRRRGRPLMADTWRCCSGRGNTTARGTCTNFDESHGQRRSHAHLSTFRSPTSAAYKHTRVSHGHPLALAQASRSTKPTKYSDPRRSGLPSVPSSSLSSLVSSSRGTLKATTDAQHARPACPNKTSSVSCEWAAAAPPPEAPRTAPRAVPRAMGTGG